MDFIQKNDKTKKLDKANPGWRSMRHDNGKPVFSSDGTMLGDRGNRSIFNDVDE